MKPRPALSVLSVLVVLPVLTALGACATSGGTRLTPLEVESFGTRTFQAPRDKVFVAAVAALGAEGYEVVFQDAETGIIKTGQKLVRTYTSSEAYRYGFLREEHTDATTVTATRRYTLEVAPAGVSGVAVRAIPAVSIGPQDVSADEVWDIDGPAGERVLWDQLFAELASMLPPR